MANSQSIGSVKNPPWAIDYELGSCNINAKAEHESSYKKFQRCYSPNGFSNLNHFLFPNLYQQNVDTKQKKKDCFIPGRKTTCEGVPQLPSCYLPHPNPYKGVVCGTCVDNNQLVELTKVLKQCSQDDPNSSQEDDDGLGFEVYPLVEPQSNETKGHFSTGAARCIHPSGFRLLESVNKTEYKNFYQLKSAEELSLYQSRLAVDNRRIRPCIPPKNESNILDTSKPLYLNAKFIRMKRRKQNKVCGPSFKVEIPGPITIN